MSTDTLALIKSTAHIKAPPMIDAPSWRPVDLARLQGTPPPEPTISGLSYPGAVSLHYGEPEAVKTWLNLIICLEQIRQERAVVWIDHEMAPTAITSRLVDLGATPEELKRFLYVQPTEPIGDDRVRSSVAAILEHYDPSLAVIDAMAGSLALHALSGDDGPDVERFYGAVIAPLKEYGAAVHVIDHVVKDRDARGRWPIGSQRKLGAADVGISVETVTPFGRGRIGLARLRVTKDRFGALPRPVAYELKLKSDPDTGRITWKFETAGGEGESFRPTILMDRTLEWLSSQPEGVTRNEIAANVTGKRAYVLQGIDLLIAEQRILELPGPKPRKLVLARGSNTGSRTGSPPVGGRNLGTSTGNHREPDGNQEPPTGVNSTIEGFEAT